MSNLSFVTHEGDGATVMFPIAVAGENIGYFRTSDIHVYVNGVEVSFTIDPNSPHLVVLTSAPADGSEVLIRRIMPKDSTYANFERGNNFGQRQVNNSFLQQLYTTQELLDGFWPEGYYWKQDVNAGGKLLKNLGDAVDPDDAVKKSTTDLIDERLSSVEEGIFSDSRYIHWLYNDGSAVGGELKIYPPFKFKTISTVYINGVRQTYGLAFDYDTGDYSVELAEELEEGDEVVVAIGTEPKEFTPSDHSLLLNRDEVGSHDASSITQSNNNYSFNYLQTLSDIANGERVSLFRNLPTSEHSKIRNQTSDYDECNLRIEELLAEGVKDLYIPDGRFFTNDSIDARDFQGKISGTSSTHSIIELIDPSLAEQANREILRIGSIGLGNIVRGLQLSSLRLKYNTPQVKSSSKSTGLLVERLYYSMIQDIEVHYPANGLQSGSDQDTVFFSNTLQNFKVLWPTRRGVSISSGVALGNTGNVISNVYISGNRGDVTSQELEFGLLLERMYDSVINQFNLEWQRVSRVGAFTRCSNMTLNGFHLEGITPSEDTKGLFNVIGSQLDFNGLGLKTVNFSGGDPETKADGGFNNGVLFDMSAEVSQNNKSRVNLTAKADNCTSANSVNNLVRSVNSYTMTGVQDSRFSIDIDDEDNIFFDSDGEPTYTVLNAPSNSHMPIVEKVNNRVLAPWSDCRLNGRTGAANSKVDWSANINPYNNYDVNDDWFVAPLSGHYSINFVMHCDGNAQIRRDRGGVVTIMSEYENTGTMCQGSQSFDFIEGDRVYIYSLGAYSGTSTDRMTIRKEG